MSNYKGHMTISVVLAVVVFFLFLGLGILFSTNFFQPATGSVVGIIFLVASVILFGLWPDIDTNSVGQDLFYPLFFILDAALIFVEMYKEAAIFGLMAMFPVMGKHRGWTHTWFAAILLPSMITVLPMIFFETGFVKETVPFSIAGIVGYSGHLILDRK